MASAPRSAEASGLVRGRFWTVLAVLLPIELIGDGLTRFLTTLPHHVFSSSFLADWAADVLSNLVDDALLRGRRGSAHGRADPRKGGHRAAEIHSVPGR